MKIGLFYLPTVGNRQEIEAGKAGLRGDLYDRMLSDLGNQAKLADDLGYDAISFTEHHFHIEGMELSNNPVMLGLYVAMQTKRINVGQLGIVLPADNPIRVAEDIAMLDHMSGGRAYAGFARGYQRRWVDVMAQQTHGVSSALPHQHDEIDATNREAFEECFQIIKKAWTEDMLNYEGKYWKIPMEGTPWDVEATNNWGAGTKDGQVTSIAVVPKPVRKPHPPIFQPFAASEKTIRWCADNDVTPILPSMHMKNENSMFDISQDASGRPRGEGIGVLRDLVIADTDEEAMALFESGGRFVGQHWFEPFGFRRGMFDPDTGEFPSPEQMVKDGYILVGSLDTVKRQLETLVSRLPVSYMTLNIAISLIPHEKLMRSLDDFATKVLPDVGITLE